MFRYTDASLRTLLRFYWLAVRNEAACAKLCTAMSTWKELEPLIDAVLKLQGKQICVYSSLSRTRGVGAHNSHFSTSLSFTFSVNHVGIAISGARLMLLGDASFSIGLDDVASFSIADGQIEIVEQFEQQTERLTQLTSS